MTFDQRSQPGQRLESAPWPDATLKLTMKEDPMGVDFQPYLIQVLARCGGTERVYPEGRAAMRADAIEFSVAKQGW